MSSDEIKYKCKVHGKLLLDSVIKGGNSNGKPLYRCKICKQITNQKSYWKNKEKVKQTRAIWYKNNKEDRGKKNKEYFINKCKADPAWKVARQDYARTTVSELKDSYVIWLLKKNSTLSPSEIPNELVELKRATIKLKREIKEMGK